MSAHTPEPWTIRYGKNGAARAIEGPKDKQPGAVGSVVRWNGIGMPACAVGKANARLIAAAPDMLKALRETKSQLQYLADKFGETGTGAAVLARVSAAIAKATGEA